MFIYMCLTEVWSASADCEILWFKNLENHSKLYKTNVNNYKATGVNMI